jgi:hypothetical protein
MHGSTNVGDVEAALAEYAEMQAQVTAIQPAYQELAAHRARLQVGGAAHTPERHVIGSPCLGVCTHCDPIWPASCG